MNGRNIRQYLRARLTGLITLIILETLPLDVTLKAICLVLNSKRGQLMGLSYLAGGAKPVPGSALVWAARGRGRGAGRGAWGQKSACAFGRGDMSPGPKAASCRRTPKVGAIPGDGQASLRDANIFPAGFFRGLKWGWDDRAERGRPAGADAGSNVPQTGDGGLDRAFSP